MNPSLSRQVWRAVTLLHRYVFRSVFATCLASVGMFAFILLTLSILRDMLNLLAEGQLTLPAFFKLTWLLLPFVFVYALPFGFITGTLLSMGRISADNEVTALRSAGVSVFRLGSSVFAMAIVGTTISLIVNFYYGPLAKTSYRRELKNTIQTNPLGYIVERTFVKDFPGKVIYVGEKRGEILRDIWIWDLDEQGRVTKFARAEEGRFAFHPDSADLELLAREASVEFRDSEDPENFRTGNYYPLSFEETAFTFSMERLIGRETFNRKLDWMTFVELRQEIAQWDSARQSAAGPAKEEAERNFLQASMVFHRNFALGFAVLSFGCIAVPLGVRSSRKETSANLGIGLGMGLLYYMMMISVDWLDGMPQLRPDLLYWAPNVIFQGVAVALFIRADHGRKPKLELRSAGGLPAHAT